MRQVSDIAKKPENASSPASAKNSQVSGMWSVMRRAVLAALQDQLEHDLAADIGEEERRESGEHPVHGLAAAPPAEIVTREEAAEDEPRDDREYGLVRERERLAEELLGEEDAAHHGEREEHEGREQDPEEERLHLEKGRQALQERRHHPAVQPLLLGEHHHRMDRGHDEEAVGEHRDREVQREEGISPAGHHVTRR